uniref:Uncharacterized protein n=1 Tax=Xenopus tropicalis TaxID=8364 RepID=A0A803JY90_XENTR
MVWKRYKNFGNITILIRFILLNHESLGWSLIWEAERTSFGMRIPKYLSMFGCHIKGKLSFILWASASVSVTFSASDLVVLILKLLWLPNLSSSLRSGGVEKKGDFTYHNSRGSSVSTNRSGERGHPCLVPFCRVMGSERVLFILSLAVGFVQWNINVINGFSAL